jgi:hypothetical protein
MPPNPVRSDAGKITDRVLGLEAGGSARLCHSACNIDPLSRGIGENWAPMRGQIEHDDVIAVGARGTEAAITQSNDSKELS